MAWQGDGTFTRDNGVNSGTETWQDDAAAATKIVADRHDVHDQDLATGIAACLTKNMETKPAADFVPNVTTTYDIGSTSLKWVDIHYSGKLINSGLSAVKSADESVTSSTTLQDDDDLQVTLAANGTYNIEFWIEIYSASATPDFKFQLIEPDGTFLGVRDFVWSAGVSTAFIDESSAATSALMIAGEYAFVNVKVLAKTSGSGGVFKLQWAQNTSDGTATTVKSGSWVKADQLI